MNPTTRTVFLRDRADEEWGTEKHARQVVESFLSWEEPPSYIRIEPLSADSYVVIASGGHA